MTTTVEVSQEQWKPVVGFDGWYDVSSLGRVRSWRKRKGRRSEPRLLTPTPNRLRDNYLHVTLISPHTQARCDRMVHQLVLLAFIGPKPATAQTARHLDGKVENNCASNLAWGTWVEQCADQVRHGTATRGERNGGAKLTQKQADEIKRRRAAGERGHVLAREYGVSEATICRIKKGLRYA